MAVAVEVGCREEGCNGARGKPLRRLEGAVAVAQEDAHQPQLRAHGEVDMTVAVEVPECQARRVRPGGVDLGRLEGAVPVAEQDPYGRASRNSDVGDAIAVEVAHGGGPKEEGHRAARPRLKGAIPVADEDTHSGAALGDDIEMAIAVKVSHGHEDPHLGIDLRGLEGPVAVAEQYTYDLGNISGIPGDSHVELAIAVEITYRQGVNLTKAGREALGGLQGAIAIAQEHTYPATRVRGHQVKLAVTIQVSHRQKASRRSDAIT